jgi:hypothetical protein
MLASIVRFLVILLIVRWVLRGIASMGRTPERATRRAGEGAVNLVRDGICNTFFPETQAVRATIAGREQLFCSSECAQRAQVLASS